MLILVCICEAEVITSKDGRENASSEKGEDYRYSYSAPSIPDTLGTA